MVRIKRKVVVFILVLGILLGGGANVLGSKPILQKQKALSYIARQCADQKDPSGFGVAFISDQHIQNERGRISVPCKLYLRPGTTLQMTNVHLETKHLLIDDTPMPQPDGAVRQPTHIVLNHTRFIGSDAGFQIKSPTKGSTVSIMDSTIDYPLSVGVSVGQGDDDNNASLVVHHNTMRSKGEATQGIMLVSTGKGIFRGNHFALHDPNDFALLLGSTCKIENNDHANERCKGP